jgi:hypothetical protein
MTESSVSTEPASAEIPRLDRPSEQSSRETRPSAGGTPSNQERGRQRGNRRLLLGALVSLSLGILFGIYPLQLLAFYLLARRILRPRAGAILTRLELAAASAYLVMVAGEIAIGGRPRIPSRNAMASLRGLFVQDEKAEFVNARNFRGVFDDGLVQAEFQTNSRGDRDDEPGVGIDAGCRVLLLGDSFAFGWALRREETIERQLELQSGGSVDAYNLGVIAYSPKKILARFEASDWWRGTAVLYLFFNNDLVNAEVDSLVIVDGYLVNRAAQEQVAAYEAEIPVVRAMIGSILGLRNVRERLRIGIHPEKALAIWPELYSPETIAGAVSKTRGMERLARSRSADFLTVIVPTRGEVEWRRYAESTEAYLRGLADQDLEVLELRDQLEPEDYFLNDGHFNGKGAQKAASAILERLGAICPAPAAVAAREGG